MPKGVIKFYEAKGYGFIEASEVSSASDESVYVHHSQISQPGYRTLKEGESVVFDLRENSGRVEAINVQRLP